MHLHARCLICKEWHPIIDDLARTYLPPITLQHVHSFVVKVIKVIMMGVRGGVRGQIIVIAVLVKLYLIGISVLLDTT